MKGSIFVERVPLVDKVLHEHGFSDYKWIRPSDVPVSQWFSVKCMYGCPDYGRNASCPPNVPSVSECSRFLAEYEKAVLIHLFCDSTLDGMREWVVRNQKELLKVEKTIFVEGMEKAFLLSFDNCNLCGTCAGNVVECRFPYMRRPTMEAFGIEVFTLVKMLGYGISVKKDTKESTDRFALLLVQ